MVGKPTMVGLPKKLGEISMTSQNNGQRGHGQNGSEMKECRCGGTTLFTCKGKLQVSEVVVHGICQDCREHTIRSLAEKLGLRIQFRNGQVEGKEQILGVAGGFLQSNQGEKLANIQILYLLVFEKDMDMSEVRRIINDVQGMHMDITICLQMAARIFEKAVRFVRKQATVAA